MALLLTATATDDVRAGRQYTVSCPCGAVVVVRGKGANRVKFCLACRQTQKCGTCGITAGHTRACPRGRPRLCRNCRADLGHEDQRKYCAACREIQCAECGRYAGGHRAACRYEARQRRPPTKLVRYNVVTAHDLVLLYVTNRPAAVRIATKICGNLYAEDVVQSIMLSLVENAAYFDRPPGRSYFLRAVARTAVRMKQYAWERYFVKMDAADVLLAEQAMTHGSAWLAWVAEDPEPETVSETVSEPMAKPVVSA